MSIAENKKAFHDYFIEEQYEAGIALEGWEVKAIRAGRANIKEAYVILRNEEVYLIGAHISALPTASTHINPDPVRTRKLLLHAEQIAKLIGNWELFIGFLLVFIMLVADRGIWGTLSPALEKLISRKKNSARGERDD